MLKAIGDIDYAPKDGESGRAVRRQQMSSIHFSNAQRNPFTYTLQLT